MVLFRNVSEGPPNSLLQVAVKNNPTACVVLYGQNSTASICCRMERATLLETWKAVPDSHEAAKDLVNALGESLQSLKRKSQQDLEEARVEKRIKVESSAGVKVESRDGLSCSSLNENDVGPMAPVVGVEGCQQTNLGYDLTEEVDELRPVVQGDEISIAVGNGTDLSDLLRGLDDSGDSEDEDDEGFGGDPPSWPSLETDFCNELIRNGNVNISEVQAQMPLAEPFDNGVDISSELEKRDDIRIEVEVRAHKTMNKEKASPEVITLDSDSDDDEDLVMYDHLDGASQLNNTVRSESGGSRQVPKESSQLENAVMQEPGSSRQVPNESPRVANAVKIEYGSAMQVPNASPQVGNAVKVEHGSPRQVPNASPQVGNAVKVEHGSPRQVPNSSPQVGNAVKVDHGSPRQVLNPSPQVGNAVNASPQVENSVKVEHGSTGQVLHNMPSPQSQVGTLQNILTPAQQQAGNVVQVRIVDGKLQPYVGITPAIPQNTSRMPISPFGGNVMHPMIRDAYASRRPSGPSTSFAPINGHVQEATSGEQAGRSQGLNPPTTSAIVLSVGAQAGGHGWNPRTTSAAVPSLGLQAGSTHVWKPRMTAAAGELAGPIHYWRPRMTSATALPSGEQAVPNSSTTSATGDQAGPSHAWNPSSTSAGVSSSGDQAGPSHTGNPPSTSAGVSSSGDQAGPSHTGNPPSTSAGVSSSGDQAGPSHGWNPPSTSAIVPYSGSSKAEPGLYDNTNLGPQNVPAHNQLAVVKPCYDSTVSTPRINVARAMQQYDAFIAKAKHDRMKEALARTASNPNEIVREGLKRGLECRPDIVAYNDMKRELGTVNTDITVGDLPGIEIGDRFTYRHQMAVIGLHRLPNVGIDYGHPPPDMIPTATAIVLMPKAGYVDDKDYGNTILYTGQGGRKKRNQQAPFVCDQELKKGNLALAKNYERKLPVRVIRGHSVLGSSGPGVLGYTYDGLYIITSYEFSLGMNGFNVYKYSLERLEGQPPIPPCIAGCTAHEWNTARGALGALPLQVMDPPPLDPNEDVKHLCN